MPKDSYAKCEAGVCSHDLALGVLLGELLGDDNPENPNPHTSIVRFNGQRAAVLDRRE
jgi:hypothetical protein